MTRFRSRFRTAQKKTQIDFLISNDGKTLARLETFDLAKNPALTIDIAGRPIRGNPAAKVTVINYDDLECPYCARMHQSLFPTAMERYKDKVRFIYKDFPLVEIHPWAMHASVNANCLASLSPEAYWTYVDYIHAHGQEVSGEDRNQDKGSRCARSHCPSASHFGQAGHRQIGRLPRQADEAQVRASAKEGESLGSKERPRCLSMASASMARFQNRKSGW